MDGTISPRFRHLHAPADVHFQYMCNTIIDIHGASTAFLSMHGAVALFTESQSCAYVVRNKN